MMDAQIDIYIGFPKGKAKKEKQKDVWKGHILSF